MSKSEIRCTVNLEARLVSLFVQTAGRYDGRIMIKRGSTEVNCKSIMAIAAMAIRAGDEVTISSTGADAPAAISALSGILSNR
ncbi:MAG: HPr family phosphocarrier protein [Defluviitaleaceae bacterium]|nr:HPr family phosphocarrier protein [Defluviitaleaceae bacterium]